MSEPFLAEVRIVGFNFAPRGWAFCDGQILPINQNQSLFALLGTMYGGDGRVTFGLPDLRGRLPVHPGGSIDRPGKRGGAESVPLASNNMPAHTHSFTAKLQAISGNATDVLPTNKVLATPADKEIYGPPEKLVDMASDALPAGTTTSAGVGQPHTNLQPCLVINYVIALQGTFPSRN